MTTYNRGDVVIAKFVFTGESGQKQRPVLVVSSDTYNQSRQEAIVAAITSNTERMLAGDHLVQDWHGAGLLLPSVATGVMRTIKQGMITRKLGTMPKPDMQVIDQNMRLSLGL